MAEKKSRLRTKIVGLFPPSLTVKHSAVNRGYPGSNPGAGVNAVWNELVILDNFLWGIECYIEQIYADKQGWGINTEVI